MNKRDIHVLKYFSSVVSVSYGKVINVTEPSLKFCPLASHLYRQLREAGDDKEAIRAAIKKAIESKIKDYGFFTERRIFSYDRALIPYGASEMLSSALKKKAVEAAVVVCEGAGTVIADDPQIVQGIGARMNSLLLTSPIEAIIKELKAYGCRVIFENAMINQYQGLKEAIAAGYKSIAVTVSGHSAAELRALRLLEKESGVRLILLAVCTSGISEDKVSLIRDHADLAWSCASLDIRRMAKTAAKIQLSKQIPVFVLTENGIDFISAYADRSESVKGLDITKQYLFSNEHSSRCLYLGGFKAFIKESGLPVEAHSAPGLKKTKEHICA
ncbi:MAG: DUF2099 family protein [Candidatus Omnitrophica bacterium]|nr:DUF2099 family protein [Candidatus Omnitrophota bacterium]